ncbi:MAG: hypothetical protein AAFV85_11475 [Cyanobacteria bacterium J06634_6]
MTQPDSSQSSGFQKNVLQRLLTSTILQSIILSSIACAIEYRFFQRTATEEPISAFSFTLILFLSSFSFICFGKAINIRFNQRFYFREEFSFNAVCSIFVFVLIGVLGFITRLMTWSIFEQLSTTLLQRDTSVRQLSPLDYLLCASITIIMSLVASQWQRQWKGRKSFQQYRQEQNSISLDLFTEGSNEIRRRFIKNGEPLYPYTEESKSDVQLQIIPSEMLSWEERAKELVRLSSSSYLFDSQSWHDREGCWIGKNKDSNGLVVVYPTQKPLSFQGVERLEKYVEKIARIEKTEVSEIIIAFQNSNLKQNSIQEKKITIRTVTEESLLDGLIDFTDYRNEIYRRVALQPLPDVTDIRLTVEDVYVDSQFSLQSDDERTAESVETYLSKWIAEPGLRQIALLGDYGQGKSTTMLMFAHRLLNKDSCVQKRIPVLIELRGKSPKTLRPLELLGAWAAQYRVEPQALMQLHYAGRLIIIFEGFDEMAMVGNVEMRLGHFKSLWLNTILCCPRTQKF